MKKNFIFLIAYFFCVYAINDPTETNYEAEVELARKSACFFIKHTKSSCIIGRPNQQVRKLTTCDHHHGELDLSRSLENDSISMFCIYDQDKKILGLPFIMDECGQAEYKTVCESIFNTLNPAIQPKAVYGKITMNKGKPVLSFYDKSELWIRDYSGISSAFCVVSKGKLELSQSGKQQIGNSLDVSGLQSIENKTNGAFIPRRFSWDVLNLIG